jgi:hypothetical protein
MRARIYLPPKNAMQSGRAQTHEWILEFLSATPKRADDLMGWIGGADTQAQVKLTFPSQTDAEAYAQKNDIAYDVELPQARRIKPKAYADNFHFARTENWTH